MAEPVRPYVADRPPVAVRRAGESEWPVIERLAQLYLHDLSEFRGYLPDREGLFSYPALERFRNDPDRRSWLITDGDLPVGFALTRPWEMGGTAMYAFFVVRARRRAGVGRVAAGELLRLIPGEWGIAFQAANAGARPFWEGVATEAVAERWHLEEGEAVGGSPHDTWLRFDTRSRP
jgi:predicted acetyltransferase